MDEGTERHGLFAKGGVGRFLLVLTVGTIVFSTVACCGTSLLSTVLGMGYFASHSEEIEGAKTEGTAAAANHTITECVTEAQARGAARCKWLAPACTTAVGNFAHACIVGATDDGYCASVAGPSGSADVGDMKRDISATLEWQRAACANVPGLWCRDVMGEVQSACWERQRKDATSAEEGSAVE